MVLLKNMLSKFFFILVLINLLFGYSIFDHIRDIKFSSSNFVSSYDSEKVSYNFSNPACNSNNNKYLYSSFGSHFDGILKTQQFLFSLKTKSSNNLNIAILRSSIDNINNTIDAWNDNGDGIIDVNEIDYNQISMFDHNTLGIIISQPFIKNNFRFGLNSKISVSNLIGEHAFYNSFDFGVYRPIKKINFGLVVKDILSYTYWTTGFSEKNNPSIVLGSNFSISPISTNIDFDLIKSEYFFGMGYNYKSLCYIQLSNSTFEEFGLGLYINFEKFNIGYSFSIPKHNQLGLNQKITFGINKNILNNYK